MTINCLLDNGAHLILIRPETITDLALPIHKLETPISITLALEGKKTISIFHDYVYLQLMSRNNEWMSKTICTLVAPGLCSNILLGLPFLTHNNIVIDHAAHTTINKETGFDLMNNSSRMAQKTTKKMIPPRVKVKSILKNHEHMMDELKMKCAERLVKQEVENTMYNSKLLDSINVIKTMIK